jgi:hypothetical protein
MTMRKRITRTGRLLIGGAGGLLAVMAVGAAPLALSEGGSYVDGLALAFSIISTTGFGPGPQTTPGLAATMAVFGAGAVCWFAIIVAAFETGLRRHAASITGANGLRRIDQDPWPRALGRREGGRG